MGVCGERRGREKSLLCGPALNVPVSDSSHMFSLWLFKESCALVCVIWKHPLFLVPYNRTSEANWAGVGSPWQSSVRVDAQRLINKESLRAILDPCHTGPSSSDHEPEKSGRWGVCVCVLHWIMRTYITDGYATGVSQLTFAFLNGVAQSWWPTLRVFTVFQCFIHWPDGLELLLLCSCLPRSFKKV